jgi:hypothetical protein
LRKLFSKLKSTEVEIIAHPRDEFFGLYLSHITGFKIQKFQPDKKYFKYYTFLTSLISSLRHDDDITILYLSPHENGLSNKSKKQLNRWMVQSIFVSKKYSWESKLIKFGSIE